MFHALQLLPWMRALAASPEYMGLQPLLPDRWTSVWAGQLKEQKTGGAAGRAWQSSRGDGEELAQMLQSASLSADDPIEAL